MNPAGYPGAWTEFLAWFPDEAACAGYLERLRWPEGIACASREPAQAVAAGNPPGLDRPRTPRRLPQRVHLPLQPPHLQAARPALLSAARAGRRHAADDLPADRPKIGRASCRERV